MKFILATLLFFITIPAIAEDFPVLDLHLPIENTFQFGVVKVEKTKNDYINYYYDYCKSSDQKKRMTDIMEEQCVCTAAKIQESMEKDEIIAMFGDTKESDFQYARMLLLSYAPCMGLTIKNVVYENCMAQRQKYKKRVCACRANKMGKEMYENTQYTVPGFSRAGFTKSESVANPIGYVLASRDFERRDDSASHACIQKYTFE